MASINTDLYEILEQTETSVKVRYKRDGCIRMRYRAHCPTCKVDRGWKKAYQVNKLCNSCKQRKTFLDSIDTSLYPNVNFMDSLRKRKKVGSSVKYRTTCLKCNKDRGYIDLSDSKALCLSCTRAEISASMTPEDKLERAKKISMAQTGDPVFSGFKTTEHKKDRSRIRDLKLNDQCFERDNYTCQKCNARGVALNAHHKNSFYKHKDLRLELNNLATLCVKCHRLFHKIFGSKNNTEEQFKEFLNS
jgi:hypothetical protein